MSSHLKRVKHIVGELFINHRLAMGECMVCGQNLWKEEVDTRLVKYKGHWVDICKKHPNKGDENE